MPFDTNHSQAESRQTPSTGGAARSDAGQLGGPGPGEHLGAHRYGGRLGHEGASGRRGGDCHLALTAGRTGGDHRCHRSVPGSTAAARLVHPALREGVLPSLFPERHRGRRGPDPPLERRAASRGRRHRDRRPSIGTPPIVDVGSSTVGTTIGTDFVRNMAVSRPNGLGGANRSFDSLAATAPNAANDIYGVAISGSQSPENSYLIDGLAVNDPAYGVNGSPLTIEFIDEVNVITGGYMPEYGRTLGGALSATTKSGGNEFHGSVFGTWTPGSLTGTPGPLTTAGGTPAILSRARPATTSTTSARPWAGTSSRTGCGSSPAPSSPRRSTATPAPTRRRRSTARATSSPTRRPASRSTTPSPVGRVAASAPSRPSTTSGSSPSSSTPTTGSASRSTGRPPPAAATATIRSAFPASSRRGIRPTPGSTRAGPTTSSIS